ncbi:MAG: discoidin domain-containing protein [Clostridia bacterium]|nr:discoidin domain-containing protein [Clostridia bacterium]
MKRKKKLYVVSNAHLDTQWNWTIQDTIRDCVKNTLKNNFELFEKYPNYVMNFEGAFRYKLAKEYYPDLYEKLKEYVKEGRWNVAGSQWDASDANVPSSEAFMRQILYGNGFFESEFGKKSTDIFLTDCFGFRYSLPSIAAHMGLNGFSTQKLVWGVGSPIINKDGSVTRPMPDKDAARVDLGKWVGPDGNYVIGSFLCCDYTMRFENDPAKRPIHDREEYLKMIEHNEKYAGVPSKMLYFGTGDYGGSATDESARYLNEAVDANGPDQAFEVVAASTDAIYNSLTPKQIENLPTYRGNLLIPHGFGAMTSHAINKRWNRKSEQLADAAERAASAAKWLGTKYPKDRIDFAWKLFLWHQFHDDLPGTSILNAYKFSYNDYVIAQNILAEELTASVGAVASKLDTDVSGIPAVVYNPVSFSRTDAVRVALPDGVTCARVYTAKGAEVPSQISDKDGVRSVIFAAKVKPVSFTVFNIVPSDTPCEMKTELRASLSGIENERYRVTVNGDGNICSIYDKKLQRELLSAPSSLGIREDNNTRWPSWEIRYEDTKLPFRDVGGVCSVEVAENGPALVALRVTKRENGSEYVQTISLVKDGGRVNVDNDVEWRCFRSLLSAGFPLTVSNPTATFDLGLGCDVGGSTDSFPYFQHLVHQWADMSDPDGKFGVSILNDCKYGMEKPNDNTLRLTLIHTPKGNFRYDSAQNKQDHGRNIFRYGFTSHGADRKAAVSEGACLNSPLIAFLPDKHKGRRDSFSFANVNNGNVVIRCIKREEKGSRLIVRVQETSGFDQKNVRLTLAADIINAKETNGYEENGKKAASKGRSVFFDMTPYSVKTFSVKIKESPVEKPLCKPVRLDYNKRVTTSRFDYGAAEFGKGIAIPEELFDKNVECGGIPFTMGKPGKKNALVCKGQKIRLPNKTKKAYIIAASADGDRTAEFKAGRTRYTFNIPDFSENIGCWDQEGSGDHAFIKREPVAVSYSHTHDKDGDRLYKFANVFMYEADMDGALNITLPKDENIIVLAITASEEVRAVKAAAPLYDVADDTGAPKHKLTVTGAEGGGEYREGDIACVYADICSENGVFSRFEGADIVYGKGNQAAVRIGKTDAEIRAVYESFGNNVVLNKPCKDSDNVHPSESGAAALDGSCRTKWCGAVRDGFASLEVDLGKSAVIGKWLVLHSGEYEDAGQNTADFTLEYKLRKDGEWKTADKVEGNTESLTVRDFKPVKARYVRLYITKPCNNGGMHARIYQFQVYESR